MKDGFSIQKALGVPADDLRIMISKNHFTYSFESKENGSRAECIVNSLKERNKPCMWCEVTGSDGRTEEASRAVM